MSGFPKDFLWGAATSAYQIEGSPLADGAGMGIWHRFTHTPGRVFENQTGDVAADHYRRWAEDVAIMADLGLEAYRFGLAWQRILPDGRGRVNQKGLDFYSRLIDALLAHGIRPMVTLYHWDMPAALDDRGGWLNPDSAAWFADFAEVVYRAYDDRVPLWVTLNEPWVVVDAGYVHGINAPGHRNRYEAPLASHHLLLAHGAAVERYRSTGKNQIGIVLDIEPKDAASENPADLAAREREDAYKNRQYLDPLVRGEYPAEVREMFGDAWPDFPASDFDRIRVPVDFIGINYYTRRVLRDAPSAWPARAEAVRVPGSTYTETGWEIYPQGLTRTLLWVKERCGDVPLYVTENGVALADPPHATNGRVDDHARVQYLRDHLLAAKAAIDQGVDLRGYFAWSLLDNFEWASGTSKRFGIVHVDYETLARTPKTSAGFYRDVIRSNGGVLDP